MRTKPKLRGPGRDAFAPKVSIIIPVYNKWEYTRRCLDSLREHTPRDLYEVIVVDNASRDATPGRLRDLGPEVRSLFNRTNQGFVRACNQGAELGRGEHLLFLNNDTQVRPGWLEAMLELVENQEKTGAVGAKLVYPNGELQEAGGVIFSDGGGWNFGKGDDPSQPRYNQACEVDYCSGACLLVRADLFRTLRGFDLRYAPAYYEDVDLCFGVRKLGYRVMYCPRAEVVHYEGVTAGRSLQAGMKQNQLTNQGKFVDKWKEALRLQDPPPGGEGAAGVTADRERLKELLAARARPNRAGGKRGPNVLVIDPTLPLYDRQAGSLRLFNLMKLMLSEGCTLTYIARDGHGVDRYTRVLQALGIETYLGTEANLHRVGFHGLESGWTLAKVLQEQYYHLAWVSFFHIAEQYLPALREHSPLTRVVIDSVDLHFVREQRQAELERSVVLRRRARQTRERELAMYRAVDAVVTVSEEERATLLAHGVARDRLKVIPILFTNAPNVPGFDRRSGILFVGNFLHPPNVDAAKFFCTKVFPRVAARLKDVKAYIVGGRPPREVEQLATDRILVTGHVPTLGPYLDACRVSVAPLRYGAGMKGKIIEAMSYGLPVVTTTIGAEGIDATDGRDLLVRDRPEAMAEAIVTLHSEKALWEGMSRRGRDLVRKQYTLQAALPVLRTLLAGVKVPLSRELAFYQDRVRRRHERLWETLSQAAPGGDDTPGRAPIASMYDSNIFRFALRYYEFRDQLLPMGTRQRWILKQLFDGLWACLKWVRRIWRKA